MTLIIAEAGVNHNGDLSIAHKLIDAASNAGADVVKFQTFKANNIASKSAKKAEYQLLLTDNKESQQKMLKNLELSEGDYYELKKHCEEAKIEFLTSAFDLDSISFIKKLNLKRLKIPSGEITNYPYLKKIGSLGLPIILSTGMSKLYEIKDAIDVLIKFGTPKKDLTVLHCTTEYPAPFKEVNLNAMLTILKTFGTNIGYSDHTEGIEVAIAAVALGAKVIEKHITLDNGMKGPDHQASLEPNIFKGMVRCIRNIEISFGDGIKKPSQSEIKNLKIVRKSLVAKQNIKKGELFTEENLTTKRPGIGIDPMNWNKIIGTTSSKDFNPDDLINL